MDTYRRVTVDILGHKFAIRTDEQENYVRQIADYVNSKSQEVLEGTKTVSTLDVAIKVAINLTDELFQERASKETLSNSVEEESHRLIHEIEAHLQDSTADK